MSARAEAWARVPGSVGNVGPGLDVLGLALAGASDEVHIAWRDAPGLEIADAGHPDLPTDPAKNTASLAAAAAFAMGGVTRGAVLRITKGLPLSGGQGGSAASAVAGAVAANHLADLGLDTAALLTAALAGEARVSGHHADNLAPSLLGGLVLVRSLDPIDVVRLPVPEALRVVQVHPAMRLRTSEARAVLPASVSRDVALHQAAHVATMVAGACLGDIALLGRGLDDRIAEPARAALLPGFLAAKRAALAAGAAGCSISGAGPTAFALVADEATGGIVMTAMQRAYAEAGMETTARIAVVDREGARAW